jgi:hypothetical protein
MTYMQMRGFTRPIDVWYDNILKILNTEAQNKTQYVSRLRKLMFPEDVDWVELDMVRKYPVLCVPLQEGDEFVLSEHSFCLHEGPHDKMNVAWADFHVFCIIAPRLAIMLRFNLLHERLDDSNDKVSSRNKQELEKILSGFRFPDEPTSLFRDLPVYKPRSGYQRNEDGSLVHSPSTQRSKGSGNSLDFPVACIDSKDLQTIKRALEFFLRMPSTGAYSLKNYSSEIGPRVLHLKRLKKASELFDPKTEGVYKLPTSEIMSEEEFVKRSGQEFSRNKPRSEPYQSYTAPMNDVLEVKRNSHSSASATLTKSSSKDFRDDSAVLEQIMARIGQLEATLPKEQPEAVEESKEPNSFFEAMKMMTQNPELTPVRRAMRAAMQPSAELDRFFESADKNRSK